VIDVLTVTGSVELSIQDDPEKTAIDCIDPVLAGGGAKLTRIVHIAMAEIGQAKLVDAAMQMKSTSLLQRLALAY
jgi:hypothetical protein